MKTLDELAVKHRTDKGSRPVGGLSAKNYTKIYAEKFEAIRQEPITLLEIGVKNGASLRMWREYFPNATIVGLDIKPECAELRIKGVDIVIGSQEDSFVLNSLESLHGPFDIIIDDGGHTTRQQQTSFKHLIDHCRLMYFIEDTHTSTMPEYVNTELNTVEYFRQIGMDEYTIEFYKSLIYVEHK